MKPVQKRIVIASILKPIDDTRMFEKMGVSLADSGRYEVYLIGYPVSHEIQYPNITFLPLPKFTRISVGRLLSSFRVMQFVLKVKPEVLLVNSHELLIVAVANRIFFGTTLIYDIQENYYRNLVHTKAFPAIIRTVLALWVRLKEKLSAPFFKWFYLAEKGYTKEMDLFGDKYTVLENKALLPSGFKKSSRKADRMQLLFSGTLAETTGVFQAIKLAHQLYKINSNITLKIIGYCAQQSVLSRIREAIGNAAYIEMVGGGDKLIPHDRIMAAISEADFGIICYPGSLHTQNSIPTKLYEYLACQLPILLQNYAPWMEICSPFEAAIVVDFDQPNTTEVITKMKEHSFYTTAPTGVTWSEEAHELLQTIDRITGSKNA